MKMNNLINDVVISGDIVEAMSNMDSGVLESCDNKAKEICRTIFPNIDLSREENIDLVIRPMSSVIAINELILQNVFSMTTLDGIVSSTTIPDSIKVKSLKNFAILNNIITVSNDVDSLLSEIMFFIKSRNKNMNSSLAESIMSNNEFVNRLLFIDGNKREMDRNKIPYIQLNHLKVMDFERTELNQGTLIDTAYSRDDYQKYQDYKKSKAIVMPGLLDVYFSTPLERITINVNKNSSERYELDEGYYIDISSPKSITLLEDDGRYWGITKTRPVLFIENGENIEEVSVVRYADTPIDEHIDADDLSVSDVLFKGFYPLFIDFNVYSKEGHSTDDILTYINEYFDTISGSMGLISHNDMSNYVAKRAGKVVISASNIASMYTSANTYFDMNVVFPVTMKDIPIPIELRKDSMSELTIKVFARSVNVIQE